MTSLDKLAKMDGWDIGEDDTGASHKSESMGMRRRIHISGAISLCAPTPLCMY